MVTVRWEGGGGMEDLDFQVVDLAVVEANLGPQGALRQLECLLYDITFGNSEMMISVMWRRL
jgi:hypothetical protein